MNMNIEYYKRNPTAFLEEYYGIKLLPHQKVIIDKMYNTPKKYYYVPTRACDFGHIKLLLSIMNLEDGATIVVASPNGSKEITKEQFIEAWVNVYKRGENRMTITEVKQDLFAIPKDYILVHCVSADFAMGAGIAKEFTKRGVKDYLLTDLITLIPEKERVGTCVVSFETGWVAEFNLITKEKYWHKPTYSTLRKSLLSAKEVITSLDDRYSEMVKLAMPKIGCGLDKLSWDKVKTIIEEVFADTDIEILVCSI